MLEPTTASYEQIRRYIMIKTPLEPADLAFVFGTRHGMTNFAEEIASYWQELLSVDRHRWRPNKGQNCV